MPRRRLILLLFVLASAGAGLAAALLGGAGVARLLWAVAALPVAAVLARDSLLALRGGTPGVDIIALLAIGGALALGEAATAALIALMVAGGTALEEFAQGRARRELTALAARTPRIAHRQEGDGIADITAEAVCAGDLLLVKPGEAVPVDGTVEGNAPATLDESALTGEPMPVARNPGEAVRSGAVNAGGPFALRATATAEASTYAAILRLVRAAEGERPPMVRLADRWALWFLPFTLAVAGGAWLLTGKPVRALAVLVVATPCPLILAVPVALVCGVSRAARHGVVVKGGGALERLARVRTALFDKTGTLTTGTPRVTGVVPLEGFTAAEVLGLAAALDQASAHVVAAAVVAAARAAELPLPLPSGAEEIPGGGLSGLVEGRQVMVGGASLLASAGLVPPETGPAGRLAAAAAAAAWVAVDGQVAGVVLLADRIRPEAPRALRTLRTAGVARLVMVTGDRAASAEAVGAALGLDALHAGLTPAGKIAVVRAEREAACAAGGACLMVGDGVNDAPALAAADVGVAMGARGTAAAAEAADAVLLVDRLDRVADAIAAARRARGIALQSVAAGMGLSAAAMGAAALGYLPPVLGALLQEAIDVAVILNALRVLSGSTRPRPLPASADLPRVLDEHVRLRALAERMRHTAERLHHPREVSGEELRGIATELRALLLPHQQAEERQVFPELARRLGGRDPLGAMAQMHDDIAEHATRFAELVEGLGGETASRAEMREAQRLLFVLDAVVSLHLAAEEALLAEVEDAPAELPFRA